MTFDQVKIGQKFRILTQQREFTKIPPFMGKSGFVINCAVERNPGETRFFNWSPISDVAYGNSLFKSEDDNEI